MCGIVGICGLGAPRPVAEGTLRGMLGMIRHRGPDQFGIYLDEHVGMGSARLSIIDLSTGQQPLCNEDGTLWIVFNGEIFNHPELREELERRGHRYATSCDTETILHAYEEWGRDCMSRFNGQFAFAIWDLRDRSLFMARDRLGVRPLFYTLSDGALVFGSEIKAILAAPGVRAALDPVALDQIFTYWSTLSPGTCFQGIQDVPPGHWLLARDGQITLKPYWEMTFPEEAAGRPIRSRTSYQEELQELLIDATRIRLRADVPVGAYLSGGLDSSTITAIIRHYTGNPLETFSISFADAAYDESDYQARMARHLGTHHNVVHASHADIGRVFPDVVWHTEAPLMRTSPAPMFLLSGLVRKHNFKVVLTGEGADEFLAGYDIFKEAKIRRFWAARPDSQLRPGLFSRIYPWIASLNQSGYTSAFFGLGLAETASRDYSHSIRWRTTARARRFFGEDLQASIRAAAPRGPAYPEGFDGWDPLHQAQFLEVSIFMSQYLLSSQGDRVGMGHSVEGRFPFLDHRVVDFCNRLPPTLKLKGLTEKFLLKEISRQWLPADISDRPKQPFRAPIHRAFFNETPPDYLEELLSPAAVKAAGCFNPRAVDQLVGKLRQGSPLSETDDMALAGIISTQLVERQFVSGFKPAPPLDGADDVKVVRAPRTPPGDQP